MTIIWSKLPIQLIYGKNYNKENADPIINSLIIKIHTNKNDLRYNKEYTINLLNNKKEPIWLEHQNIEVDVVLIPLTENIKSEEVVMAYMSKEVMNFSNIKIPSAEKIFALGYPFGFYDKQNNLPIMRIGHLISQFEVGFNGNSYMLGDLESHDGMSGAPVFIKILDYETKDGKRMMNQWVIRLVGILSSSPIFKDKEKIIEPRIIIIWFPWLIEEILLQNTIKEKKNG